MDDNIGKLLNDVLAHHRTFKDSGYIVKDSYPILYFGDYERYCASKIKIITVGINPSKEEFPSNNKYQRFPEIKSANLLNYLDAYNDYFKKDFKRDPYESWFNSYEKVLNEVKCSYYNKEGFCRALHTDIYTPLATKPTWSKLPKDFKDGLKTAGVPLWHSLVKILKPDVIICSFAEKRLKEIRFDLLESWEEFLTIKKEKDGKCRKTPYLVKKAKIGIDNGSAYIFWGNQRNTPFGSIADEDKKDIGDRILKFIQKK